MVKYKFHYFDSRGLGEAVRLLFIYADQPFEDIRINIEKWSQEKQKYFYEKMPLLEVDGKQLAQTGAILRYLANQFGLAGKDEWEKAKVDEVYDYFKDVYAELAPYLYVKSGWLAGNLGETQKDVSLPGVTVLFPKFVKLLEQSGSGFFAPSGLTYVDFVVAEYLHTLRRNASDVLDKYPELSAFVERMHALPQLKKHLATRKDTN